MKIIKQEKDFFENDEFHGNVLHGKEYLKRTDLSELKNFERVYHVNDKLMHIKEMKNFVYECPFISGNKYFWFVPSFHFTNIENKKNPHNVVNTYLKKDILNDIREALKPYNADKVPFYNENIYMGHGYTDFTLPSDGMWRKEVACVELDNGDILVGKVFVWYNK